MSSPSAPGPTRPFLASVRTLFSPTTSSSLLSDLAPDLLRLHPFQFPNPTSLGAITSGRSSIVSIGAGSVQLRGKLGLGNGYNRDATSLYIIERVDELLEMEIPPLTGAYSNGGGGGGKGEGENVPLIRGFMATTSIASTSRIERRKKRAGVSSKLLGLEEGESLGLRERESAARGLMGSEQKEEEGLGIGGKRKKIKGKGGQRKEERGEMSFEELVAEEKEIVGDMENVVVKRAVINSQIHDVEVKINELAAIRDDLRRSLLGLREEELELEDELQGVRESRSIQEERTQGRTSTNASSSRRRKGPAFLPSEHDELPNGVAFMTLHGHLASITSLDFSEPYGVAVTASSDESVRVWDLTTGEEMGFLRGHDGAVKALQVESNICITGGADGTLRIWDLDLAESIFHQSPPPLLSPSNVEAITNSFENVLLGKAHPEDVFGIGAGPTVANGSSRDDGVMREAAGRKEERSPCVKTLDGHTKAVTSLYFDGNCLVTGSSDRTLRQWDLATGQCVLTMDILWAISNPLVSQTLSSEAPTDIYVDRADAYFSASPFSSPVSSPAKPARRAPLPRTPSSFLGGGFGSPGMADYTDGSWERKEDFVGGVQFWGYALASGTGDGCVRMWDMRTGQAHRTLVGHTGPVSCVQFDEVHLVSGSLDKSIRIWDLRTGSISDTIRYEHPITALQFDSRKIIAAAGENAVRVFNRTTLQHSKLSVNGHTAPVEKLRFMDRYLATGGKDSMVKIWSL